MTNMTVTGNNPPAVPPGSTPTPGVNTGATVDPRSGATTVGVLGDGSGQLTLKIAPSSASNATVNGLEGTTQSPPIVAVNWGAIGGNILDQIDLQQEFALKAGLAELNAHIADHNNPHAVTKAQVGLDQVDNISAMNMPVSTAQAIAIAAATIPVPVSILNGGTGATTAPNALTNLGGGTTGKSVFATATPAAARGILGSSSSGDTVFTGTPAASRTALGSGTIGDLVFQANTDAAALQAMGAGILPVGQCYLNLTSVTLLTLTPQNGNQLFINGVYRTIPAAGVTLSSVGLTTAAGLTYNIYAFWNGTNIVLEGANVARATDTTYGHQIKTGDPTRTLVGKAWCDATGWGIANPLLCISWFNRRKRTVSSAFPVSGAPAYATTTTPVDASGTIGAMGGQVYCQSWGEDAITVIANGPVTLGSAGTVYFFNAALFNNLSTSLGSGPGSYYQNPVNAGQWFSFNCPLVSLQAETLGSGSVAGAYVRGGFNVWSNGAGAVVTFAGPGGGLMTLEIMG